MYSSPCFLFDAAPYTHAGLEEKYDAIWESGIDASDYIASRSSRFNYGVRTPGSHRIRDCVGPESYLCALN
jgi:hypothetical protein